VAKLTAKKRKKMPKKQFALPEGTGPDKSTDQYPINDEEHAVQALARGKQNLSPEDYAKLVAKVCAKFPGLPLCAQRRNAGMNNAIRGAAQKNVATSTPTG
jgi:hypothetical protein